MQKHEQQNGFFLETLKERAAFFLVEKEDFIPFRTIMQSDSEVKDIISNSESGKIEVQYQLLLIQIQQDLKDENIKASAIVLTGKADGYNTVVIEIFSNFKNKYQAVFPYTIIGNRVNFGADLNKDYHTII
nr:hypothetical protein [Pedobacter sp. ASV2]